uniref:Integron gene cassette protein n=2 Tax=uncultured bacterium TaxID=77133 RepID=A0ACD6B9H2_9BACT|nr:putative integron gene cassette protein [uncultured bacterium]
MESVNTSFLSPSLVTIRDFDNGQFAVLRIGRTGFPADKGDIDLCLDKMKGVRDAQQSIGDDTEFGFKGPHIRIRCVDIDDKHTYNAMVYVDLIVGTGASEVERETAEELAKEKLRAALQVDIADEHSCVTQFEMKLREELLSSDSFHPDKDEYYKDFL